MSARLRVRNAIGELVHAIQLEALRVQFANSRDDGGWEDSARIGVRALNVAQRMLSIYSRENGDFHQTCEKQIIQFKRTCVSIIIAGP